MRDARPETRRSTRRGRRRRARTGAHDRVLPFPGWDLPGVLTAGGAQALLKEHGVARRSRAPSSPAPAPSCCPSAAALAEAGGAGRRGRRGRRRPRAGPAAGAPPPEPAARSPTERGTRALLARHRVPVHLRTGDRRGARAGPAGGRHRRPARRRVGTLPGTEREVSCDTRPSATASSRGSSSPSRPGCATRPGPDGTPAVAGRRRRRTDVPGRPRRRGDHRHRRRRPRPRSQGAIAGTAAAAVAAGGSRRRRIPPSPRAGSGCEAFAAALHRAHPVRRRLDGLADATTPRLPLRGGAGRRRPRGRHGARRRPTRAPSSCSPGPAWAGARAGSAATAVAAITARPPARALDPYADLLDGPAGPSPSPSLSASSPHSPGRPLGPHPSSHRLTLPTPGGSCMTTTPTLARRPRRHRAAAAATGPDAASPPTSTPTPSTSRWLVDERLRRRRPQRLAGRVPDAHRRGARRGRRDRRRRPPAAGSRSCRASPPTARPSPGAGPSRPPRRARHRVHAAAAERLPGRRARRGRALPRGGQGRAADRRLQQPVSTPRST